MNLNLILVNLSGASFRRQANEKLFFFLILGDLIDVHAKQEDGWWLGALKNKIGIFPATYVEEIA